MSFYSFIKHTVGYVFKLFHHITITGKENIPDEKGFLLCANHTSMLDVVMLVVPFDRRITFMAKKEIFKFPPFAAFFRGMGAFPVDRSRADIKAIRTAMKKVQDGEAVCMFPQGTRCKYVDPATTQVRSGIGMVAYHAGCDVLPVYIKTKGNHVRIFKKTEVIVGKPITNADLGFEKGGKAEYETAARKVFHEICSLGGYDFPIEKPAEEKAEKTGDSE